MNHLEREFDRREFLKKGASVAGALVLLAAGSFKGENLADANPDISPSQTPTPVKSQAETPVQRAGRYFANLGVELPSLTPTPTLSRVCAETGVQYIGNPCLSTPTSTLVVFKREPIQTFTATSTLPGVCAADGVGTGYVGHPCWNTKMSILTSTVITTSAANANLSKDFGGRDFELNVASS